MGVLASILEVKRSEIAELKYARLPAPPPRRPIELRRLGGPLRVIAEIKLRSPSAGELSHTLSVRDRAAAYERAGASMVSVLCDRRFFRGSFAHLRQARERTRIPLLCKEFVVDEVQLDSARAWGADAVLLIVRCLKPARVAALIKAASDRDLVPLVEVMTESEAALALDGGARVIGVNARDLDTLVMNSARAKRVLAGLPPDIVRIHLSGLSRPEDLRSVARGNVDAALIGEALMREDDPEPLLTRLVAAAAGTEA
jgi:indole-3-glycerol phosphate synthase